MACEFITLIRTPNGGTTDTSSLQLLPGGKLVVIGNLPHNCEIAIRPRDLERLVEHVKAAEVPVVFRVWKDGHGQDDVIALFPSLPGTTDPGTCSSYQHVGQHGSASYDGVMEATRAATPAEYADLQRELESNPYFYLLRPVKRATDAMYRARWKEVARASRAAAGTT